MHIHQLSLQDSILNTFISEIRDGKTQRDSMRFRRNIERIGEILAYELSKTLNYGIHETKTPLGLSKSKIIKNEVVLCSVLRAGVPLHNGLLNYFDKAENAFISAFRHHKKDPTSFDIVVEYLACPDLNDKTLVLADPMLATGRSLLATFEALKPYGKPKEIHLVCVIGAKQGIDFIRKGFPDSSHLWIADIDEELNDRGYIIPGLGDAGDLAYGKKLQN